MTQELLYSAPPPEGWVIVFKPEISEIELRIISLYRQGMIHKEIGAEVGLSESAVSNVVQRLIKHGYVERRGR